MSKITRELNTEVLNTQYGFRWGDVLVERICSNKKNPKFQILRVHTLNGDCIEITIRPRSNRVETVPNPEL